IPVSKGVRGAEDRGGSRQTGGLAPLRQALYSAAIARLVRILLDQMRRRIDHLDRVGDRVHPRGRGVAQAARDDAGFANASRTRPGMTIADHLGTDLMYPRNELIHTRELGRRRRIAGLGLAFELLENLDDTRTQRGVGSL